MTRRALSLLGTLALVACTRAPHRVAAAPPVTAIVDAGADDAGDGGAEEEDTDGMAEAEDALPDLPAQGQDDKGPCPPGMAQVNAFCIDRWEASLVEVMPDGTEKPFPHWLPVDGHEVRAVSAAGAFPQGYISEVQAADACDASGKRLCAYDEWKSACMGPGKTTFPYGDARRPGACWDTGKSAVGVVFGARALANSTPVVVKRAAETTKTRPTKPTSKKKPTAKASGKPKGTKKPAPGTSKKGAPARASAKPSGVDDAVWTKLNDPNLGQVDGALSKTGDHAECTNAYGVFDMVGNLHEWVITTPSGKNGTFAGGYYLDTAQNGDGCNYKTQAHAHEYHDYSTGFRCCAAAR